MKIVTLCQAIAGARNEIEARYGVDIWRQNCGPVSRVPFSTSRSRLFIRLVCLSCRGRWSMEYN